MRTVNRSRGLRALTVLGGGVVAAGLLVAAAPAQAAALSCGTTVTTSVTLTANVNCAKDPNDDAITVGASGITINLNGHKILGPGDTNITVGIGDGGFHNVTIENGTISNFNAGVQVGGKSGDLVTGLRLKNLTITENTLGDTNYGIFASYMGGATMTGLTIKNANYGVYLENSANNTLTGSTLTSPITGIWDQNGTGNTWSHDTMSNVNYVGVWEFGSTGAVITANTIHGIAATGILDEESLSCAITRNTLTGLSTGIDTSYDKYTIVSGNAGSGDAYGMYVDAPFDGTFTRNVFSGDQYGIEDYDPYTDTFKSNITDGNAEAGIWINISDTSPPNTFAVTLTGNTANRNQFGLYSQIHTKGSGNHATGNTVVNCHGVSCVKPPGPGLLVAPAPAQAAQAASLSCGTTIKTSVTLTRNVNCAANHNDDAITIGASGITINLNGHKILGPGDANITVGIGDGGYHNVTIENGTISNFYAGLDVSGRSGDLVTGLRVRNVTITENTLGDTDYGVFANYLGGATMTGLTIKNANDGVYLDNSEKNTVTASTLASPITGFYDEHGTGNTWSHDTMSNVSDTGIWEDNGSPGEAITANTVRGLGATGIEVDSSSHSSVTRNRLNGLYTGISVYEDEHTTVRANSGSGDAYGLNAGSGADNTYAGNVLDGDLFGMTDFNPQHDTFESNITDGNAEGGIWITVGSTASYPVTLTGNTASKNQFGLYSQIHTTGTGNHATGNTIVNCHNVSCA